MESVDLQTVATDAYSFFERKTRDNGESFYATTKDAPEWLESLVYDAHGDFMPDDFRYDMIHTALSLMSDGYSVDDWEPDIYNFDLLKWVSSNLNRMGYVDEIIGEIEVDSLSSLLMLGQREEFREVWDSVESSLTSRVEELESEASEDELEDDTEDETE